MAENENPQEPSAPLPTLGEELKRQREIRGITLKEIADSTKVGKRFLEALERDDHKTLPAPAFTRGFIREYARYLGLNPDELVSRYMQIVAAREAEEESQQPAYVHKFDSRPIPRSAVSRVDRRVWPLFIIVIAIAAAIWFFFFRANRHAETAVPASTTSASSPVAAPVPAVATAPATQANASSDLTLHLTVNEPSWVILYVDGEKAVNDELPRGFDRSFTAKNAFDFKTIGNAGGIVLTLNGVQVPQLGPSGKVLHDKVLDRDFLSGLSAPQHP